MDVRRSRRYVKRYVKAFLYRVVIVVAIIGTLTLIGLLMRDGSIKNEINKDGIVDNKEVFMEEEKSEDTAVSLDVSKQYPKELEELLEKNPETESFVMNYPEKRGTVTRKPLSEYAGCSEVPLLLQWDERWGYYLYGDGVMGLTGCGPTCLSMIAIYLLGDLNMTPVWMADFCVENGYCREGNGTSWELMSDGAQQLGLVSTELPLDEQTIASHLQAGEPVVCVMGPGDFTDEGHFIVLTEWEDGLVTVNDPNSRSNSEKRWEFEQIKYQIRNLWAFTKT